MCTQTHRSFFAVLGSERLFEKSGNERFDQCRATSEDATITLSLLKSIMPIFMWIPFQAAMETFQTASEAQAGVQPHTLIETLGGESEGAQNMKETRESRGVLALSAHTLEST